MDHTDLHLRFKELSEPLQIKPTDTEPHLEKLADIRVIAYDFYGTLFISGVGDIGVDDGNLDSSIFMEILNGAGIQIKSSIAADKGFEIYNRVVNRFIENLKQKGIEYPEPDIREVWSEVLQVMKSEELVTFVDSPLLHKTISVEFESRINPVWPMPGVKKTLHYFKKLGIPQGIISNSQFYTPIVLEALTDSSLSELGFHPSLLHWSFEEQMKKPGLTFYRNYLKKLTTFNSTLKAEHVLYIGNDMLKDVWPAHTIGMKTALFAGDSRSLKWRREDPRCENLKPDLVITELSQLTDVI